jgi:hypothetical protein
MKWYGLDMQMSDIEFAVKVYHLFYDDSQLSRIFKKAEDAETDKFERSLRECIQKRIDVEASDWRKYSDKQRKCKKMKIIFNADNNRKLIQLKNEVCPNLEIDAFNGTIDFGIGLPSVDESLPMKKRYAKKRNCDKIDYAAIKRGISQQLLESAMFNANFG